MKVLQFLPLALTADLSAASGDACNFGPTHHSHIVVPLTSSAEECMKPNATFILSHGATFFCPHTFDVKLRATIVEQSARDTLCKTHFSSLAQGVSSKVVLRPTLPAGDLPAEARGESTTWASPVMYHVHNFGKDNDAGPDAGWNVTTIRNDTTTVNFRTIYGRLLDVQPKPAQLTYLAHAAGAPGRAVLSHYISTSGSSGFDHILKADVLELEHGQETRAVLRETWPTFITFPDRSDSLNERLTGNDTHVDAVMHTYDEAGLPLTKSVMVHVSLDYYFGTSDGFAGYGTMCPTKSPLSPTTCFHPESTEL